MNSIFQYTVAFRFVLRFWYPRVSVNISPFARTQNLLIKSYGSILVRQKSLHEGISSYVSMRGKSSNRFGNCHHHKRTDKLYRVSCLFVLFAV